MQDKQTQQAKAESGSTLSAAAPPITLTDQEPGGTTETFAALEGRVSSHASAAAVVLAGGSGERFGNEDGKQLYELLGRPALTWSAEAFDAVPEVGLIVIVCPEERRDEYCRVAIDPYPFVTPIVFASSGAIRQESAMSGLDEVPSQYEYVIIHDGARPLVTPELIVHTLNELKGNIEADGVVVGHQAIDTLKVVDEDERYIVGTPDRRLFWVAQTPQIFRADFCRRAFSAAMFEGFVGTDDSSLIERMGGKVLMVNGPRDNIKVTVPEDVGPVVAALESRVRSRSN
ncbi:MAG: 2-C-methyl-D-erythritol 4-phosphate cytidylyltransferase [Coriobacteriaceae bacterium]|nr:2-C-methyl-D-erythritol 4-phosphate cytidylyltransferase [Coriobacteriaceae bacterium]